MNGEATYDDLLEIGIATYGYQNKYLFESYSAFFESRLCLDKVGGRDIDTPVVIGKMRRFFRVDRMSDEYLNAICAAQGFDVEADSSLIKLYNPKIGSLNIFDTPEKIEKNYGYGGFSSGIGLGNMSSQKAYYLTVEQSQRYSELKSKYDRKQERIKAEKEMQKKMHEIEMKNIRASITEHRKTISSLYTDTKDIHKKRFTTTSNRFTKRSFQHMKSYKTSILWQLM